MRILVSYRGIPQSKGWATGDFVVSAFRVLGHEVSPYGNYYQTKERIEGLDQESLLRQDWDLVVFMECNDDDPQYRELFALKSRRKVTWMFDTSYYRDHARSLVRGFDADINFIANPREMWRFPNAHYLPYAADASKHLRDLVPDTTNRVALFGSVRPDRTKLVKDAARLGVDVALVGGVFREAYVEALSQTAMTVNQNPVVGAGLLNMRSFEAPAAGSLLFLEQRDARSNRGFLDAHTECVPYRSVRQLVKIAKSLNENPKELLERRKRGQEAIRGRHLYTHRCDELLNRVEMMRGRMS